jgi:hypothetical protein
MNHENQEYKYVSYSIETEDYNKELIHEKSYVSNGVTYNILNNDSNYLCFDDSYTGLYRSIITDDTHKILCFSPPNALTLDYFKTKYPVMSDTIYANEVIEGTMINLFYDKRIQKWEISTRGAVGGNYWYYRTQYCYNNENDNMPKQKTFREMFLEAIFANDNTLESSPMFEYFPKDYSYSFVLQHSDNHIVFSIESPRIFLVAVYEACETSVRYIPQTVYEEWDCFKNGIIVFPYRFIDYSYEELEQKYSSIHSDYSIVGIMLTNIDTGDRTTIKNPVYEELKQLRGNNPNLQYQYFCLARIEQKNQFLEHFPVYKKLFHQFGKQYNDFITNVHQSYFSYYVKKEGIPIAKKFFIHASKIHHTIYLPSLNETKIIITRAVVKNYFDALTPSELLYYLNYDKRQIRKINPSTNEDVLDNISDSSMPELIVG